MTPDTVIESLRRAAPEHCHVRQGGICASEPCARLQALAFPHSAQRLKWNSLGPWNSHYRERRRAA